MRQSDIVIVGGGFAGLTLALQLIKNQPGLTITVIDKLQYPAPESTFKVGESMVEISSWYLREVLGLGEHLNECHLPKLGLRYFMTNTNASDFAARPEYGLFRLQDTSPPWGLHLTTYNIDRGILENYLYQECQNNGVDIIKDCKVTSIQLAENHLVVTEKNKITAKWIIDASGRTGLLARKTGQRAFNEHTINAVWFRLKGRIKPEHLSNKDDFQKRINPDLRWYSTNHLIGKGYWIWLIPLKNEATSVGIMLDPAQYDFDSVNQFKKALHWLKSQEPQLAEAINALELMDFRAMKTQSYFSQQSFSANRWALSGESAFFTDALYSPGGDFIAVSNTLITQMIAADMAKNLMQFSILLKFGEKLLNGMFNHYMGLYRGMYQLLENPSVMLQKVAWDTAIYFAYNVLLFRNGCLCDPHFHRTIGNENLQLEKLQKKMIYQFKNSSIKRTIRDGFYIDQSLVQPVQSLYESSIDYLTPDALKVRLSQNIDILDRFSSSINELTSV